MKTGFIKYTLAVAAALTFSFAASAQETGNAAGYDYVDSLVYRTVPAVDSLLLGSDIFSVLPQRRTGDKGGVTIVQSQMVEESMRTHILANKGRAIHGYRIRIFFDNSQSARRTSAGALAFFVSHYKGIPAYRSYVNPYFKVTVGDFRTKAEAMEQLVTIKRDFPSAFIVKEKINFPNIGRKPMETIVDTVKVYRKKPETDTL